MTLWFFMGLIIGSMIFEPIIINIIYFSNIDLFMDIILNSKNKKKLIEYIKNKK